MNEFEKWWATYNSFGRSESQVARAAFEAGAASQREKDAKICDKWIDVNHVYKNGAIRCAEDIRNQK